MEILLILVNLAILTAAIILGVRMGVRRWRIRHCRLPRLHYLGKHDANVQYDQAAFEQIVRNWYQTSRERGRHARPRRWLR